MAVYIEYLHVRRPFNFASTFSVCLTVRTSQVWPPTYAAIVSEVDRLRGFGIGCGKTISYKIQFHVVLEQCFRAGEDKRESLG